MIGGEDAGMNPNLLEIINRGFQLLNPSGEGNQPHICFTRIIDFSTMDYEQCRIFR